MRAYNFIPSLIGLEEGNQTMFTTSIHVTRMMCVTTCKRLSCHAIVFKTLIVISIDGFSNSLLKPFCIQVETYVVNLWILDCKVFATLYLRYHYIMFYPWFNIVNIFGGGDLPSFYNSKIGMPTHLKVKHLRIF